MRPLKIRLEGDFWDSTVYNDRLVLVLADGTIQSYSWDSVVGILLQRYPALSVQFRHFLTRGKAWYGLAIQDLIRDPECRSLLEGLVTAAETADFVITRRELAALPHTRSRMAVFPSTDLECYASTLFIASTDGLAVANMTTRGELDALSSGRVYDAPILSLSASYGRLAMAQGDDGLAETPASSVRFDRNTDSFREFARPISASHCDHCQWLNFDIIATARDRGGYISAFEKPDPDEPRTPPELLGTVSSTELFSTTGGTLIGASGVVALVTRDEVISDSWNPFRTKEGDPVIARRGPTTQRMKLSGKTPIVDAGLSAFGVIVEYDNRIVIRRTDGKVQSLPGEAVSWRVFPRSERYVNHLHVVRERWIDIYAFVHDYFVRPQERGLASKRPKASTW